MNASKIRWQLYLWKIQSCSVQFWKHLLFDLCEFWTQFLRISQIKLNRLLKSWFANVLTIKRIFLVFSCVKLPRSFVPDAILPILWISEESIQCFLEMHTSCFFFFLWLDVFPLFMSDKWTKGFIVKYQISSVILSIYCLCYKFYSEMLSDKSWHKSFTAILKHLSLKIIHFVYLKKNLLLFIISGWCLFAVFLQILPFICRISPARYPKHKGVLLDLFSLGLMSPEVTG